MPSWDSFIAWYFDLPKPEPGDGARWRLLLRNPWGPDWPNWLVMTLAILAIVVLVVASRRESPTLGRRTRWTLLTLRAAALALTLLLLAEPAVTVERTGLPTLGILVDTSASMGFAEQASDRPGSADNAPSTRFDRVRSLFEPGDQEWLDSLQSSHAIVLRGFDSTLHTLPMTQTSNDEPEATPESAPLTWTPTGAETRLASAVRSLLTELRGTPPVAVVVFSDGVSSAGDSERLSSVAETLRRRGIPLHVVGLGSDQPARDLSVDELLVDDFAYLHDPVLLTGRIQSTGYAGKPLSVQVRKTETGEVLAELQRAAPADGVVEQVELSFVPTEAGDYEIAFGIPAQPGETNENNNFRTRTIHVREEHSRVLLVDSVPRYEFRFLKQLLDRHPTIELKTVLQEADLEFAGEDRTALTHLPVGETALQEFDAIILGDISIGLLTPDSLSRLADSVRRDGGGLILVAGSAHNPQDFAGTPLEPLLPFSIDDLAATSDESMREAFQPRLTVLGRKGNSLFRFAETEAESFEIWNNLPGLYWFLAINRLKPGALVYAEHPHRRNGDSAYPLIISLRVGEGQVLYHATDELWRWRYRVGDLYYARYWIQAIRSVSRAARQGDQAPAELTADRLVYESGESAVIRLRFLDDRQVPTDGQPVTVMLERSEAGQRLINLAPATDAPTLFEGRSEPLAEGNYHAWLVHPGLSQTPLALDFQVRAPQREQERQSADLADLKLAAEKSFGRFYRPEDVADLAENIPSGKTVVLSSETPRPLWSRWEPLLLLAALLTAEWILRKRARLI